MIEDPDAIVDLTSRIDESGRLDWDVPAGEWTIMRFVCANTGLALVLPSPNSGGLAIDHFNPEATRYHFEYLLDKLHQELGDFQGHGPQADVRVQLRAERLDVDAGLPRGVPERRGYDMTKYLPVLAGCVVEDTDVAERFEYDYRKTLGDLLVDAFYRTATELSNEHGLRLCAEAGGPGPPLHQVPVDALKAQGAMDIPRGEFWKDHDVWVVKETACAAHIYGKRLVDMEAFTSWRHWQDGPFELKPMADRAFCDGTNHFTFHTSAHNPSADGPARLGLPRGHALGAEHRLVAQGRGLDRLSVPLLVPAAAGAVRGRCLLLLRRPGLQLRPAQAHRPVPGLRLRL